jgi:hypothetical protein
LEVSFVGIGQTVTLHDGKTAELCYTAFRFEPDGEILALADLQAPPEYAIYINSGSFFIVASNMPAPGAVIYGFNHLGAVRVPVNVWDIISIEPSYITILERVDVLGTSAVVSKYSYEWWNHTSNLFNATPTSSMRDFFHDGPHELTLLKELSVKQIIKSGDDVILRPIVLPAHAVVIPKSTNAIDAIIIRDLAGTEYLITDYCRESGAINGIPIREIFYGLNMAG